MASQPQGTCKFRELAACKGWVCLYHSGDKPPPTTLFKRTQVLIKGKTRPLIWVATPKSNQPLARNAEMRKGLWEVSFESSQVPTILTRLYPDSLTVSSNLRRGALFFQSKMVDVRGSGECKSANMPSHIPG